jgi:hypothetical protein
MICARTCRTNWIITHIRHKCGEQLTPLLHVTVTPICATFTAGAANLVATSPSLAMQNLPFEISEMALNLVREPSVEPVGS